MKFFDEESKWEPEIIVQCQTPGRQLFEALEHVKEKFLGRPKDSWPFDVNPNCKCNYCRSPNDQDPPDPR